MVAYVSDNKIFDTFAQMRKVLKITLSVACFYLICGCANPSKVKLPPAPSSQQIHQAQSTRQEVEANASRSGTALISIEGASTLRLPMTPGIFDTSSDNTRHYDYYVYAPSDVNQSAKTRLTSGALRIDVIGAEAEIKPVEYGSGEPNKFRESHDAYLVRLNSDTIGPAVKIIALNFNKSNIWEADTAKMIDEKKVSFKEHYDKYVANKRKDEISLQLCGKIKDEIERLLTQKNPYIDVKDIQILSGDLHTELQVLDASAAKAAFGPHFIRYFHVARARFTNRHDTKSLIVNTTSMRARVLFYRSPQPSVLSDQKGNSSGEDERGILSRNRPSNAALISKRTETGLTEDQVDTIISFYRTKVADILSSESLAQIAEKAWPEFERETGSSFVGEQEAEGKRIGTRTLYKLNKLSKNLIRTDEGTNKFKAYVSESRYETRQLLIEGSREVGNFDTASQEAVGEIKIEYLNSISPISRPESITAGLTNMPLASSQNVDLQRKLAGAGYVFQGYYRPMTLSAVIVSLIDRTETSGRNIAIKTLESMGVIAAALVGIDTFGATLTSRRFSQSVVIATGIIIPESRKRFWEDSSIYLKNLGNLALESTLELKANESRDGYVFFPKGAIYGFGIDEFSIQHPTYIVNIDRGSLAVEGKIIEASTRLNAGSNPGVSGISESTQLANSINEGQPRRESDELRLQDSVARVRVYEETRARNKVHALLEQGTPEEASKLLAVYKKIYGDSPEFRMLGERVSQFLDRGSLICLEASNEAKETSLVKLSQNADTTWTGVYKVRLSGPHASSAYSTIVESTLKLSNGDELASGKNISALTFTDAVWYKPQDLKLTITQEEKEKAEKQGLTVVHTIRSQDSRFSGQKTVEVSLPAVQ